MTKDYVLRREACILLEQDRLMKKGIQSEQANTLARHSVYKTLWILRNKACMSRMQALSILEDRQVQKRSKVKIMYFWQNKEYLSTLEYTSMLEDRIILLETVKNYCLASQNKKNSYLWYARLARRLDLKPKELIEVTERWKAQAL